MAKKNLALISHSILQELLRASGDNELGRVVKVIATKMGVAVCSCYILRTGDLLELAATYGLDQSAVGRTFLRINEGVVGEVATYRRTVNLRNAWKSKHFSYRPETKENEMKSFLGVPIMKSDRFLGVLCIQNTNTVRFLPEEEELLKTMAMFIAEMITADDFADGPIASNYMGHEGVHLHGIDISGGLGMGKAVMHRQVQPVIKLVAKNPEIEQKRLQKALGAMQEQIAGIMDGLKTQKGEHVDILGTYFMFSNDKSWVAKLQEAVKTGLTAEAAAQKVFEDIKARFEQSADEYLKERIHDFDDLTKRLLSHLSGNITIDVHNLPENIILCAQNMGPSELFDYEFGRIKGIVLEEGAKNMHVAIIARSLGIPIVGGLPKVLKRIEGNDTIIVNGAKAEIFIRPPPETLEKFEKQLSFMKRKEKQREKLLDLPVKTKDGVDVRLNINAGLLIDMEALKYYGADGVGLYRTELAFLMSSKLPDVDAQIDLYRSVIRKAEGRPVVFRTLDVGADKLLSYFQVDQDENPAMGWRSIRISIDRKAIFRHQLRAIIRAVDGGDLNIMFPMVASVSEFKEARKALDKELALEKERGNPVPRKLKVGTMLEVPSLIFQMKALTSQVDFISVGTNDLLQFLYACDRGNVSVYERYDTLSPAMLRALAIIKKDCDEAKVPCSICGEMAGNPLDAMVLIGLGFRDLSMNPSSIISVKEMVLSLDTGILKGYIESFKGSSSNSLREHFRNFAIDHGVVIDGYGITG